MKRKFINDKNINILRTDSVGRKKAFNNSPIPVVSEPDGTLYFVSLLGDLTNSDANTCVGTISAVRVDGKDFPYFLNADYYYIYTTGAPTIFEVTGPDKDREHRFLILPIELVPPGMEKKYYGECFYKIYPSGAVTL
ncbi:MAG: hypothetical protein Q7S60_04370 [bacterium]|nr:hypothetical protein [bacterium]